MKRRIRIKERFIEVDDSGIKRLSEEELTELAHSLLDEIGEVVFWETYRQLESLQKGEPLQHEVAFSCCGGIDAHAVGCKRGG